MELALPWLKLVGILVSGIVGCVLTLRFAIAAVWWAKKNAADGASFMFSTYLDRVLGNGPWWSESGTNPSAPQHGLWSQFTDWLGEKIDAMNESPGSTSGDAADVHQNWNDTSHHSSCGDGGSGSGDGASSC